MRIAKVCSAVTLVAISSLSLTACSDEPSYHEAAVDQTTQLQDSLQKLLTDYSNHVTESKVSHVSDDATLVFNEGSEVSHPALRTGKGAVPRKWAAWDKELTALGERICTDSNMFNAAYRAGSRTSEAAAIAKIRADDSTLNKLDRQL